MSPILDGFVTLGRVFYHILAKEVVVPACSGFLSSCSEVFALPTPILKVLSRAQNWSWSWLRFVFDLYASTPESDLMRDKLERCRQVLLQREVFDIQAPGDYLEPGEFSELVQSVGDFRPVYTSSPGVVAFSSNQMHYSNELGDKILTSGEDLDLMLPYDHKRVLITEKSLVRRTVGSISTVFCPWYLWPVFYPQGNLYQCSAVARARLGKTLAYKPTFHISDFAGFLALDWPKLDYQPHDLDGAIEDHVWFEDMLRRMPGAKAAVYRDTAYRIAHLIPNTNDQRDSMFVKAELLAKPSYRLITAGARELMFPLANLMHGICTVFAADGFRVQRADGSWLVYSIGNCMTSADKGVWRTVADRESHVYHLVTGGDDSLLFMPNGSCIEADVTACDQSHHAICVELLVALFKRMGVVDADLAKFEESYVNSVSNKLSFVEFRKPQLHTGHPHTSVANTLLVMCVYVAAFMGGGDICVSLPEVAKGLGMDWKIEVVDKSLATFHKGYFVRDQMHESWLWSPLPSRVWKIMKAKTSGQLSFSYMRNVADNCNSLRYETLHPLLRQLVTVFGDERDPPLFDFDRYKPVNQFVDFLGDGDYFDHVAFTQMRYLHSWDLVADLGDKLSRFGSTVRVQGFHSFLSMWVRRDYLLSGFEYASLFVDAEKQ